MNAAIEILNALGEQLLRFGWPILWQSSLLMVIVFCLDHLLAKKVRTAVRYALWLVVLVKLLLPPTLALPTGVAWWLTQPKLVPAPVVKKFTVTHDETLPPLDFTPQSIPLLPPPVPKLELTGWLLLAVATLSALLLIWMIIRWWQVTRMVRKATLWETNSDVLASARNLAKQRSVVRLKIVEGKMSPAVCGLFRPVILLPRELAEKLSTEQLRAVLLHELFHLRRGDVWVNCAQALLQIAYWWHPLLWVANARIRRLREEAVDDAVMLALREESDVYAPTLLEVAKLAFRRPLLSLGLVGIMESRSALRQRIERLMDFRAPRKAGLTFASFCGICVFSAVALPMGEAPTPMEQQTNAFALATVLTNTAINVKATSPSNLLTDPNFRAVIHALEQRNGSGKLAEPEVKTTSGRGINKITIPSISVPVSSNNIPKPFYSGPGRQKITQKLSLIRLERVSFASTSLPEVARYLARQAKSNDPETNGINFLINPNPDVVGQSLILDLGSTRTNLMADLLITINPPLTNATLGDVLDAVILGASEPIHYSIQDFAIVFSAGKPVVPLFSRVFAVNVAAFASGMGIDTAGQTNSSVRVVAAFRKYVTGLGVNLESPPGKVIFLNDRLNRLYVKATQADLDIVEGAIDTIAPPPPQIHIKAWFVAVPKKVLGRTGIFATLTNSLTDGFTGILVGTNAQFLLKMLKSSKGVEFLAEPEVTATSGRQTQMRATTKQDIITAVSFEQQAEMPGVVVSNNNTFKMEPIETGPIFDSTATVLADRYTVNLRVKASLTEFFGYASPRNPDGTQPGNTDVIALPKIRPSLRVREKQFTANVYSGQILVLGDFQAKTSAEENFPKQQDKELLTLVIATIVDSAGNRVYPDDSSGEIPPQPSQPK